MSVTNTLQHVNVLKEVTEEHTLPDGTEQVQTPKRFMDPVTKEIKEKIELVEQTKFVTKTITKRAWVQELLPTQSVVFACEYSKNPEDENFKYSQRVQGGNLSLNIVDQSHFDQYKINEVYELNI